VTAVAERLARVPSAGMSFDALTFLADDPSVRNRILDAPAPTLGFNFQGEAPTQSAGGLFALLESPLGDLWDPEGGVRQPPLYVECSIVAGTTRIGWEYLPRQLNWSGAEIDEWRTAFADELAGLVRRGQGPATTRMPRPATW
jgi:non-ribosomal peptide synthase protein (TIGR01720 family)